MLCFITTQIYLPYFQNLYWLAGSTYRSRKFYFVLAGENDKFVIINRLRQNNLYKFYSTFIDYNCNNVILYIISYNSYFLKKPIYNFPTPALRATVVHHVRAPKCWSPPRSTCSGSISLRLFSQQWWQNYVGIRYLSGNLHSFTAYNCKICFVKIYNSEFLIHFVDKIEWTILTKSKTFHNAIQCNLRIIINFIIFILR